MAFSLHHIAIWTPDLDQAAGFWVSCFDAQISEPYQSKRRPGFVSRFATLPDGLRVELMTAPWVAHREHDETQGWDHIALSLGSRAAVDAFASRTRAQGTLLAEPRETGDGYYEAIVVAPGGLRIEITA